MQRSHSQRIARGAAAAAAACLCLWPISTASASAPARVAKKTELVAEGSATVKSVLLGLHLYRTAAKVRVSIDGRLARVLKHTRKQKHLFAGWP